MEGNAIWSLIEKLSQAPFEKPWGNYLLEDIVENQAPQHISWLPQTLGWYVLSACLLSLIIKKCYQRYQVYQRNAYRREALTWLAKCQQTNDLEMYKQLPVLLRSTALKAYDRSDISQLNGSHWEHWLDKQCPQTDFSKTCPNVLHQLAYKPTSTESFDSKQYQTLLTQIGLWIKHHKGRYE